MKTRKLLAVLLCLCMVFSLIPMASAEETTPLATEDEVVIYYTNDVHTYIDKDLSYDNIADLKQQTAAVAADVLLVDAGDHIQGTAYGSMDKGETIVELMEAAGYDVATLGNHEFDYGMDRALEVATMGNVQYVSCNFYNEEDGVVGQNVLPSYYLYSTDKLSIAIIGVTTPESFTKSTPAYFQDEDGNYIYGIAGGEDGSELYAAVQAAIDEVSGEVDLVIALAHLGDDPASQPWTSEEMIANTTGLDAVIDGHSHSTVPMKEVADAEGNTVVLTQTGEYFDAIGRMVIDLDTLSIETGLITVDNETLTDEEGNVTGEVQHVYLDDEEMDWTIGSDENVAEIKNAWIDEIEAQLGEVIGYTEVTLDNYDADGNRLVRLQETNTGDFAADALYYLFEDMGLDVDVAIMNGGVRNKAVTGEISYKTCKNIHTFGNVACLQTVTGQQILDALEWGARGASEEEVGGFLQVSGLTYEIHTYIESTVQYDDKNVWTGGPTGEYRVKNVKILQDGEWVDLDLDAEYNLAGYNYTLRDLGDGFAMFDGAVNVLDYVSEDYMVLANYVQSFPVNEETGLPTITAENSPYADVYGEGRIVLVEEAPEDPTEPSEPEDPTEPSEPEQPTEPSEPAEPERPFTDVKEGAWYYDYVYALYDQGIVKGMSATTFEPEGTLTRAQFAALLYRALGLDVQAGDSPFSDVKEGAWYYNEVVTMAEMGVCEGLPGGVFAPNKAITRQEIVTMLYRATKVDVEAEADLTSFTDASSISEYALAAMKWAVSEGVIEGMGNGTLAPKGETTRAQAAALIYRWMQLLEVL